MSHRSGGLPHNVTARGFPRAKQYQSRNITIGVGVNENSPHRYETEYLRVRSESEGLFSLTFTTLIQSVRL